MREAIDSLALRYLDDALAEDEQRQLFEAIEQPDDAEALIELIALEQALRTTLASAPAAARRRPARWLVAAAALLAAGVSLGLWLMAPPSGGGPQQASSSPSPSSDAPQQLTGGGTVRALGPARWELVGDELRLTSGTLEVSLPGGASRPSSLLIDTPSGRVSARRAHFLVAADDGGNGDPTMKRTRVLVMAGLLTLSNLHGAIDGRSGMLLAGEPEAAPRELVQSTTEFSLDLYRKLAKAQPDGNLTCSPYSVHAALAMLLEGARGETRQELARALRIPVKDGQPDPIRWASARLRAGLAKLRAQLAATEGVSLEIANRVIVDRAFPLRPELRRALGEHAAAVVNEDLANDAAGAQQRINRWVSQQTRGKISEALSAPPAANTRMLLLNALAFRGQWLLPFDPEETRPQAFTLADGTRVKVPTMHKKLRPVLGGGDRPAAFRAARLQLAGEPVWLVELPYRGGQLAMSLIIPAKGKLAALEQGLQPEVLSRAHAKLGVTRNPLYLPKFKLRSRLDLRSSLTALGAAKIFGGGDLGGFTTSTTELFVGRVSHQATLEIDEKGTTGAAVTEIDVLEKSEVEEIRADRPFLALVRDPKTGAILFMARVADPR